ncbi:hypothetical protein TNIN_247811 [Trichonephila inaurata madagascariensis]|uniref:Uncharacterized protein n=1 Tax=Trichonephila inaurata madagascariensis TaxID=2747483 RepID=A0A8X6KHW3_9ARAC|nr:hypothetical protein TNIN_247811 [Trichonephila inaurata madagascariensis]
MQNQRKSYYVGNTVFVYDEGFSNRSSNRSSVQVISHLCGECNISFSQFEQSALHIQKKRKEQFFQCPLCLLCFSDINVCSEHYKTCKPQNYTCAKCGIFLSEDGENFILEPLLFYNLAENPPDVTSKNIFKKYRLFFTVKKYRIIHETDSLIGASLTKTVNPINTSVSNIETKHSIRQDLDITENNTYSTESDELIILDSISETCKLESLSQRTSQLAHLHGNFFDSKNKVFTNTLQRNKVSDVCITKSNEGSLKKSIQRDVLTQRIDNTVESHCKKLKTTTPELTSCKSGDRISVLDNGMDLPHIKRNKKVGNHEKPKITQHQENGTKSSQAKKKKTLRKPILCRFGEVKVKFFTLNKKVHHSYNFIKEQSSIEDNESEELDRPLADLKMILQKNSKQQKLTAMKKDKCQILKCNKEQFSCIVDSRKDPIANNQTRSINDEKLLHTDVEQSKSFIHGTTKCSSNQMSILKSKGIIASRVSENYLRNGKTCNKNNNLMKETTGEENWEKLKNVYNLKKCSVDLHNLLPSQIYNASTSSLKNAFKSENEIKDLSVILFRLPNYVQDYQSYKIYCQSQVHNTVMRKKQKKKSKDNTNFIHNILPSLAPEVGDISSVAECEISVCIRSSNHVKMSSSSNGEHSHESQSQDYCHQISETLSESSSLITDDYEMSDDSEQHIELQSPNNSTSEYSKTSNDDKCPSLSEEPVELQFDDIGYQPMTEVSESPHLVSNFTNDIRQTASNESDDLIYCDNSQLILKSVDKTRIKVSNTFESSIPFVSWKIEKQLRYLKDRIKYIKKTLKECKNKKVEYLEPRVLLDKLPEVLVQTLLQTKLAKDIDAIEVIKLSRIRFALQLYRLNSPTFKIFKHKPMGIRTRG